MTVFSTILALGFLPLNMFIYGRSFESELEIPYANLSITVACVLVFAFLGAITNWRAPKASIIITKVGSTSHRRLKYILVCVSCIRVFRTARLNFWEL